MSAPSPEPWSFKHPQSTRVIEPPSSWHHPEGAQRELGRVGSRHHKDEPREGRHKYIMRPLRRRLYVVSPLAYRALDRGKHNYALDFLIIGALTIITANPNKGSTTNGTNISRSQHRKA